MTSISFIYTVLLPPVGANRCASSFCIGDFYSLLFRSCLRIARRGSFPPRSWPRWQCLTPAFQ